MPFRPLMRFSSPPSPQHAPACTHPQTETQTDSDQTQTLLQFLMQGASCASDLNELSIPAWSVHALQAPDEISPVFRPGRSPDVSPQCGLRCHGHCRKSRAHDSSSQKRPASNLICCAIPEKTFHWLALPLLGLVKCLGRLSWASPTRTGVTEVMYRPKKRDECTLLHWTMFAHWPSNLPSMRSETMKSRQYCDGCE